MPCVQAAEKNRDGADIQIVSEVKDNIPVFTGHAVGALGRKGVSKPEKGERSKDG